MKRFFKTAGICIVILLVIIAISYGFIANNIKGRASQEYYYSIDTLMIRQNKESLQRGKHLVAIKGCTDCHGNDLGGKVFLDDPKVGRVSASNLTIGRGGLPSDYQVSNWIMALRHGVNKERKALWIMPSQETAMLSREDLASIIAYCMQVKPVNREMPKNKIGPMLNILAFMDKFPLFPVEKIDHSQKVVESVNNYSPVEMGKYLSVSCVSEDFLYPGPMYEHYLGNSFIATFKVGAKSMMRSRVFSFGNSLTGIAIMS